MGRVVPLLETEMTNVIPMWMDAPAKKAPPTQQFTDDKSAVSTITTLQYWSRKSLTGSFLKYMLFKNNKSL